MVTIGLLSDTHNYLDTQVFTHFEACDEIWHAGDIGEWSVVEQLQAFKPLRAVYCNIDNHIIRAQFPEDNLFEIEGVKVYMTHIGGYPPKYNTRTKAVIKKESPHLFIAGHSHILKIMYDKDLQCLHINPGAAGKHGWHKIKTLIRFVIDKGVIKNCEVIEIGPRAAL